ncbi:Crp/Fnr family transcriptional regulator [Spirosoma endbachense]|uniref:Cyclic nucleotide-binding domain-containing protein n=1 Tax=Spirosoma endbachense TaxID=2666025 RepID=A0A6P1W9T3_9BACT|nr:Crp/Fnr family transcriptional regulator [Spirosoma endbachense]QHW00671.1 cyclic nucleotide-binding domain-containing protein [Spirosoma endbachense]
MDILREFLQESGFDAGEQSSIIGQFHRRELSKGNLFAQAGRVCDQLAFVEKGLFQFFADRDGDEITTYTAGTADFVVSLGSFLKQQPSRESIRALTDSVLWSISRQSFNQLRQTIPSFELFYMGLLEDQINCIEESRYNLLTLSAEERYQKLMTDEPHLLQEVPLQYLASILGVTPRHLSRIRGQIR